MRENSQPYQLVPVVNKYRRLHTRFPLVDGDNDAHVEELMLLGFPESLQEFVGLWPGLRSDLVIWIGHGDCFVHINNFSLSRPDGFDFRIAWDLWWGTEDGLGLHICCTSLQGALDCLDNLTHLDDAFFMKGLLTFYLPPRLVGGEVCQLSCDLLRQLICQNPQRVCGFASMMFTPAQGRTLATCGTRTSLEFEKSRFQDFGTAFREAYLASENEKSGPVKLRFDYVAAFDDTNLIACLNKLEALELNSIHLSAALSRAIAALSNLKCLKLNSLGSPGECILGDGGEALVQCMREGRGPTSISLSPCVFDSPGRFVQFCSALRRRAHVDSLELSNIGGTVSEYLQEAATAISDGNLDLNRPSRLAIMASEIHHAVLDVLKQDLGLTSFAIYRLRSDDAIWNSLLDRIVMQSSLRKFTCQYVTIYDSKTTPAARTEQIANMIIASKSIEEFTLTKKNMYDQEVWAKYVVPALHYNRHRERFAAIGGLVSNRWRGAMLAQALEKVNEVPSLLDILLHQHMDTILRAAEDHDSLVGH